MFIVSFQVSLYNKVKVLVIFSLWEWEFLIGIFGVSYEGTILWRNLNILFLRHIDLNSFNFQLIEDFSMDVEYVSSFVSDLNHSFA